MLVSSRRPGGTCDRAAPRPRSSQEGGKRRRWRAEDDSADAEEEEEAHDTNPSTNTNPSKRPRAGAPPPTVQPDVAPTVVVAEFTVGSRRTFPDSHEYLWDCETAPEAVIPAAYLSRGGQGTDDDPTATPLVFFDDPAGSFAAWYRAVVRSTDAFLDRIHHVDVDGPRTRTAAQSAAFCSDMNGKLVNHGDGRYELLVRHKPATWWNRRHGIATQWFSTDRQERHIGRPTSTTDADDDARSPALFASVCIAPAAVYVPKETGRHRNRDWDRDRHDAPAPNLAFRLVQARPLGPDELGDQDRRALRAPSQRGPEYRAEELGRVLARDTPAARCRV